MAEGINGKRIPSLFELDFLGSANSREFERDDVVFWGNNNSMNTQQAGERKHWRQGQKKGRKKLTNGINEQYNQSSRKNSGTFPYQVDENAVLEFIIINHLGQCQVKDLEDELFDGITPHEIIQHLWPFHRIKVFRKASNISESMVFVHLQPLSLCAHMPCRAGDECKFLHLCSNFVTGSCRFGPRCRYSHDVRDSHNQPIVQRCNFDYMFKDDDVLLELVRCSNLSACSTYFATEGQLCCDPDSCLKLHVCIDFLRNKCLLDESSCEYGHNLYDGRNKTLLSLYGMLKGPVTKQKEHFLFRRILKPGFNSGALNANSHTKYKSSNKRASESPKAFTSITESYSDEVDDFLFVDKKTFPTINYFRQPALTGASKVYPDAYQSNDKICSSNTNLQAAEVSHSVFGKSSQWGLSSAENSVTQVQAVSGKPLTSSCGRFEKHLCDTSSTCTVLHGTVPYLWRICLKKNWIELEDSCAIEKEFSDPQITSFRTSFRKTINITIDFENMDSIIGPIQRLSTPSYVVCRNNSDATNWRWYWNCGDENHKMWLLYEDNKPPYQDVLESKFQFDRTRTFCFETDDTQYLINFKTMRQVNMTTGYERRVCRRPLHLPELQKRFPVYFHYDPSKLPSNGGWVPMNTELDGWTDLIPIDKDHHETKQCYSMVSTEFHMTMSKNDFAIKNVFHIQNLDLWKKYQEKKTKMEKRGSVRERSLFHGTDDEKTVRCICHQNFDHRMHGVHGTVYGKGAYFALTSKYSHQYTKPIPSTGSRFMFFASVLLGKSVLGKTEYKRPPPLDSAREHLGLYDSCVNDELNPTIFVVFNDDQYYPEFLIEYKDLRPSAVERPQRPPPIAPSNVSTSQFSYAIPSPSAASAYTIPQSSTSQIPARRSGVFSDLGTATAQSGHQSTYSNFPSSYSQVPINSSSSFGSSSQIPSQQPSKKSREKSGCYVM